MDQDIPDNFTAILEFVTFVQTFLQPSTFEFWSRRFTAVMILGSQREGLCTTTLHGYWQAVMTSFEQELLGSTLHGSSLYPFLKRIPLCKK